MRIQHNIMAMNAYRNYTGNANALSLNLEKLSSGYRINRAGDDAAGLAISEKMRAQITGLDAAQKNVQDGISLVKTAEGAMQEVQDMLNRMVYLATQSSNGTYDDEVDRVNLQKEVDQLRDEIDRIADSANFNGIKLLDGSLDGSATTINGKFSFAGVGVRQMANGQLPAVGTILGTDTVLHKDPGTLAEQTTFSIDLHNLSWENEARSSLTIQVGDNHTFTIAGGAKNVTTPGASGVFESDEFTEPVKTGTLSIGGFTAEVTTTAGTTLSAQLDEWINAYNATDRVNTWTAAKNVAGTAIEFTAVTAGAVGESGPAALPTGATETTTGAEATKAQYKSTVAVGTAFADGATFAIDGVNYEILANNTDTLTNASYTGVLAADATAGWFADKIAAAVNADATSKFTAEVTNAATGEITYTAKTAGAPGTTGDGTPTATTVTVTGTGAMTETVGTLEANTGTDAVNSVATYTPAAPTADSAQITIGGFTATGITSTDLAGQLAEFVEQYNADVNNTEYTASLNDANTKVVFTAKVAGLVGGTVAGVPADAPEDTNQVNGGVDEVTAATAKAMSAKDIAALFGAGSSQIELDGQALTSSTVTINGSKFDITASGTRITFTQQKDDAGMPAGDMAVTINVDTDDMATPNGITGDYNKSTTVIAQKGEAAAGRLASTWFNLTADMVEAGNTVKIGSSTYTFGDGNGQVKISDLDANDADYLSQVAERLTNAAKGNTTYTVGHDGNRITVTENVGQKNFDLTTTDGILKSLGFSSVGDPTGAGLVLQIGDTSDSYNQLSVNIADIHTKMLKDEDGVSIEDIDITSIEGAQAAVNTIKSAINQISSIRGTLGATQNRLEHTANNLSVMEENIQNAESAIRDTDIADEMTAYTKNNILLQAAQAMLAQANQVPQGVLQLLQ